ncbi:MAG: putative bifunctional diguanylate cyclase/phosphodiesterase [Actinomycetes bacterium]
MIAVEATGEGVAELRTSWRLLTGVALASPALLLLAAEVVPGAALDIALSVHALSLIAAGSAMFVTARSGDPRLRRARLWLAAALGAAAAGFVVSAVYAAMVPVLPTLSPANLAPLMWVPAALIGFFSVPSDAHREGGRPRAVLDAVVVTCAMGLLFWMLLLEPLYHASSRTGLEKAVLLGYPIVDFVVAVVAVAVAGNARGDLRRFLQLAAVGMLLVAVADAGSAARIASGVESFDWTNVVLQGGLATLVWGALLPTTGLSEQRTRLIGWVDAALPHLPIVVTAVVGVEQVLIRQQVIDEVVAVLGGVMVLGLVARQVLYSSHVSAIAERLSRDATIDHLTGLANRRSCLASLEVSMVECAPGTVAVVLLDLDGFKEVNDTFGHAVGDQLLGEFGRRLRHDAGDTALPARLGGDEFAIVLVAPDALDRAGRVADALTQGHRSTVGAVTVSVGASAGIATSRAGDTASGILRRADLAMYEAKRSRSARVAVFTDDMAERAERRHLLTQALPGAAARGELRLVYQPMVSLADGAVIGAEALLRWRSPVHGDVPPMEFVPLAEETGAIVEIGAWVLDAAARELAAWASSGLVLPVLSVNVSPHQLVEEFADEAVRAVRAQGVEPSAFMLEITESAMPDLNANRCVARLRHVGFSIAMDDFGSGFSSLAQLAALPVDTLKFDREFIRGVRSRNGRRIVDGMISLARDLGLRTVAEGIETAAEADVVRRAGCDVAQGYWFARPVVAAELEAVLVRAFVPGPREAGVGADELAG